MKIDMIQILKNKGWLVVAAALTIILSACTRDDIAEGAQQAGRAQKINVTVGAGFDADAATRSDVVYNETDKTRTLIFTKGDKLFFNGGIGEPQKDGDLYYYNYKLSGFLPMVEGSLSSDGKSAMFTGDLNLLTPKKIEDVYGTYYVYEKNADATYDFDGKDPISLTTYQDVRLLHENAVENKDYEVSDEELLYVINWAPDVKTLMTTIMVVGSYSEYDAEKKSFKLHNMNGPVFNCTISGLAANTTYQLSYLWTPWEGYDCDEVYPTPIKADAQGEVAFAIFANTSTTNIIKFTPLDSDGHIDDEGEVMKVNLGALDLKDDMVYNVVREAISENYMVDVEVDATSPLAISSAISVALETADGAFPVNFILTGNVVTATGDTDITIPTKNSAGKFINAFLTFKKMPSEAGGTLTIKSEWAGIGSTTEAKNKLTVVLPESEEGINLNIDAPTSTVSLKSSGTATKFKEVVARTAFNTLVVDDDVTVSNAEIKDGVMQINDKGILESWSFGAKANGDQVNILEDGGIEPLLIPRTDAEGNPYNVYQITTEDGNPYYAHSLKIVKDEADYSVVHFYNPSYETIPLKTVVVGDGATLQTNYISMENIVGEGTGVIKYRLTGVPTSYTDDTQYGGEKFYEYNSDMSGVKTVKDITFGQPEIAPDENVIDELNAKKAQGYRMNEPRLNLDVEKEVSGCTFNFNHVFFCPELTLTCPLVKNCKFVHVTHDLDVITIGSDLVEFRIPYDASKESNTFTFDGCEFSAGTKFSGYFFNRDNTWGWDTDNPGDEIHYTGYINFKNCKMGSADFTGETLDFAKNTLGWSFSGTRMVICFNGVETYESVDGGVLKPIGADEPDPGIDAPDGYGEGGDPTK